jgi:DNA-binding transcriptional LysR family regulator
MLHLLNMSPQSVSRVIKSLEDTYGELLFHRNTRTIRITKFGEQLLSGARHALDVVNDIFLLGKQKQLEDELCGTVTITTPSVIQGASTLCLLINQRTVAHDNHHSNLLSSVYFVDLVHRIRSA